MSQDRLRNLVFLLSCTFVILGSIYLCFSIWPAEDAMILFRYVRNLAESGIISYNGNSYQAVEGSTDFLWMICLSTFHFLNLPIYLSALLLSFIGMALAWVQLRKTFPSKDKVWMWGVMAIVLAPQWWAGIQGFSVLWFTGLICWFFSSVLREKPWEVALASLCCCLTRPDAVVFVLPLLGFLAFKQEKRAKYYLPILFGFVLPGALYFAWRWNYFQAFLPLPFYVKGMQEKDLGLFSSASVIYLLIYLIRYVGLLILPVSMKARKWKPQSWAFFLGGVLIPSLFYMTVVLEQNVAHRFVMPILLAVLFLFLMNWEQMKRPIWWMAIYLLLSSGYSFTYFVRTLPLQYDQIAHLGQELSRYPGKLATTEAGKIPFYSDWETLDLWGLNSPELSLQLPDSAILSSFEPDLIYLDDETAVSLLIQQIDSPYRKQKEWDNMVFNSLKYGIETGSYSYYWIPVQEDKSNWSVWDKGLFSSISNSYTNKEDLILLNNSFSYFDEVERLILMHRGRKATKLYP
ncbi:MAG: hypothetical protein AAFY71_09770 [Bacteroidota bacterium]